MLILDENWKEWVALALKNAESLTFIAISNLSNFFWKKFSGLIFKLARGRYCSSKTFWVSLGSQNTRFFKFSLIEPINLHNPYKQSRFLRSFSKGLSIPSLSIAKIWNRWKNLSETRLLPESTLNSPVSRLREKIPETDSTAYSNCLYCYWL